MDRLIYLAFASILVTSAFAAVGDTWTADLRPYSLPPGAPLGKGKGTAELTITEADGNMYLWDVTAYSE